MTSRRCAVCGKDISHRRASAITCSSGCREQKRLRSGPQIPPAPPSPDDPPDIAITKAKIALEDLAIKQIQRERESHDLRRALGELVPLSEVEGEFIARAVAIRAKFLAVPSRFKQRRPHLVIEDVTELEDLLREVLEELASEEAAVEDEADEEERPPPSP